MSFVATLWINAVGGTCKMNIEMALKSESYILDLDCVKLSLGFFFLSCSTAFRIYLYFCQKHTAKSPKFNVWPNLTCCTDSFVLPWRAIYASISNIFQNNSLSCHTTFKTMCFFIKAGYCLDIHALAHVKNKVCASSWSPCPLFMYLLQRAYICFKSVAVTL